MRNWKNWLAPILTGLTVVALALLPLHLSILQDAALTGTVHAEDLAENSNFPAKPPEMLRRIHLLAQFEEQPDILTIVGQALEGSALAENLELARRELAALTDAWVLPESINPDNAELFASKLYLRDQTDLSSAGFVNLGGYDKASGEYRSLVLDGEAGQLLELKINYQSVLSTGPDPAELGAAFLDRLGVEYEMILYEEAFSAGFRLRDTPVVYLVTQSRHSLSITPELDWEALDLSQGQSAALGFPTDAAVSGN